MAWVPTVLAIVQGVISIVTELTKPSQPKEVISDELIKMRREARELGRRDIDKLSKEISQVSSEYQREQRSDI